MANDPSVPEAQRTAWKDWGLCQDEFTDNGGWPRAFYVRNGRRLVGDFVLTEAHVRKADPEPIDDSVGIIWLPYRCLLPKQTEVTNLLSPTCPSSSYVAYGAYRIEFTFMVAAQSAATAAEIAIDAGLPLGEVSHPALRDRLPADGQVLSIPE